MKNQAIVQEIGTFMEIPLRLLDLSPYNARRFEERMTPERQRKFDELVASVREKGVIQPIAARPVATEEGEIRYEIMAGERRFRAAREVGNERGTFAVDAIPAMVYEVDDKTAFDIMTTENLQREDLSPVEKAESFKAALASGGPDALKDLSKRLGIPAHAIRLQVALLDLPKPVLDAWDGGRITLAHVEQFTRLSEEKAILEALTECLRQRYTVQELAGAISAQKPPLKAAKFDAGGCAGCISNSSLQGSLFQTGKEEGVCLNPACFKARQGAFFTENWAHSKAKEVLGTNSFRFKDDLTATAFRVIAAEAQARCQECPEFVSIVSVAGAVVKGQERVCLGASTCFDELYGRPVSASTASKGRRPQAVMPERAAEAGAGEGASPGGEADPEEAGGGAATGGTGSKDDEKKSLRRGETFREKLYGEALPQKIRTLPPNQPSAVRLYILALALESASAREALCKKAGVEGIGLSAGKEKIAAQVFELAQEELLPTLLEMALHPIMNDAAFNAVSSPAIRDLTAHHLGIDFKAQWQITEEYLNAMTKAEIVAMGEEEEVALWKEERVKAYKEKHHPKKGWMSLKKPDLIDCILKSGVDLAGRVPAEIHTKGRAD